MTLRWIPQSRVSMQRAGMIVIVTAAASPRQPITLEKVTRKFGDLLRRRVSVPMHRREQVAEYLASLRLWKRYGRLQGGEALGDEATVELQDLWLADPVVPAATGAITDDVIDDLPQLAVSMRLVRDENFTRTDRAKALLLTLSDEQRALLRPGATEVDPNLLALSAGTQLILLYALLDADGDFIRTAYKTTEVLDGGQFTRADFSSGLNVACRELLAREKRRMRTGAQRKLLTRLDEWATAIDKPRGSGRNWGGGRPPEQLATLRLEPFVDLGLIDRLDRYAYRYTVKKSQQAFFDSLAASEDIGGFLRKELVGCWLEAQGGRGQRLEPHETWSWIVAAYDSMRSTLGFASFVEVTLVAITQLLEAKPGYYFELQDGIDVIAEQRNQAPDRVRLGINRAGDLTYMKLVSQRRDG